MYANGRRGKCCATIGESNYDDTVGYARLGLGTQAVIGGLIFMIIKQFTKSTLLLPPNPELFLPPVLRRNGNC